MKEGADMLAEKETEVDELRERLCVLLESRGELQQLKELLASLEEDSGEGEGEEEGEGDGQGGRRRNMDRNAGVNEDEDEDEENVDNNDGDGDTRNESECDTDAVDVTLQRRQEDVVINKDGPGHSSVTCEPTAPALPLEVDNRGVQGARGVMENPDLSSAAAVSPPSSSGMPLNAPEQYPYPVHDAVPSPSKQSSVSDGTAIPFIDKHVSAAAAVPVSVPVPAFVPASLEGISASTLSALLTPPKKQSPSPVPSSSSSSHPLDSRTQNREGSPSEGKEKSNSRWHTRELL